MKYLLPAILLLANGCGISSQYIKKAECEKFASEESARVIQGLQRIPTYKVIQDDSLKQKLVDALGKIRRQEKRINKIPDANFELKRKAQNLPMCK